MLRFTTVVILFTGAVECRNLYRRPRGSLQPFVKRVHKYSNIIEAVDSGMRVKKSIFRLFITAHGQQLRCFAYSRSVFRGEATEKRKGAWSSLVNRQKKIVISSVASFSYSKLSPSMICVWTQSTVWKNHRPTIESIQWEQWCSLGVGNAVVSDSPWSRPFGSDPFLEETGTVSDVWPWSFYIQLSSCSYWLCQNLQPLFFILFCYCLVFRFHWLFDISSFSLLSIQLTDRHWQASSRRRFGPLRLLSV